MAIYTCIWNTDGACMHACVQLILIHSHTTHGSYNVILLLTVFGLIVNTKSY